MTLRDTTDATTPAVNHQHTELNQNLFRDSYPQQHAGSLAGPTGDTKAGKPSPGPEAGKSPSHSLPGLELTGDLSTAKAGSGMSGADSRQNMIEGAQKTLANPNASAAEKLSTVEKLGQSGVKNIQVADQDGKMRDYSINTEKAGSRTMVHLMGKDDQGHDQVALRGIDNGNGTFSQEKDSHGRSVGFEGDHWTAAHPGTNTVGTFSDGQSAPPADAGQKPVPNGEGVPAAKPQQPGQPERPADNPQQSRYPDAPAEKSPQPGQPDAPAEKQQQPGQPSAAAEKPQQPGQPAAPGDKPAWQTPAADAGDGKGPKPTDGTNPQEGKVDRSQFDKQLEDPRVMAAFAGRMDKEVGTQGKAAQVAFAEEVMNRAAARGQTLMHALSGKYYPTSHPGSSHNPEFIDSIKQAQAGSDTIHGATGNASGTKGFGMRGGHYDQNKQWVSPNQVANIGGERFGYEQQDLNRGWLDKYNELKGDVAAGSR